jgi:hypothetical protein
MAIFGIPMDVDTIQKMPIICHALGGECSISGVVRAAT